MPLIVVSGDPVTGTDTHNLTGQATDTSTGSPVPWVGTGSFTYTGSMTSGLSSFVRVGGAAVAVTTSSSALDPGEDVPPVGGHSGPAGSQLVADPAQPPTAPTPLPPTLVITDMVGTGTPSESAGSRLVRVGGEGVLLDSDPIDTCDGTGSTGNSAVAADGQQFVTASA